MSELKITRQNSKIKVYLIFPILLFSLFFLSKVANAGSYYVDFQNGNDSSDGLSTSTAWKHIPGTRNTADTGDIATSWGASSNPTFSSSKKVSAGTVFKLKSGTTHNSSNGGRMYLSNSDSSNHPGTGYYASDISHLNPIIFQRDTTWGNGSVVFDGNGMTFPTQQYMESVGMFFMQNQLAFKWDGVSGVSNDYDGIIIQNVANMGIASTVLTSNITTDGPMFQYVRFHNVATRATSANAWGGSRGIISLTATANAMNVTIDNVTVDHIEISGNGVYTNGFVIGQDEPSRGINTLVTNSIAYGLNGTDENDAGIGWKAQNSQVVYKNVTGFNNAKGFDNGEEGGGSIWDIRYVLLNSMAYNNSVMGAGFSNSSRAGDRTAKYYVINSIFRNNSGPGVKMYAGPNSVYITGNVFDNNDYQILAHCDGPSDTQSIRVYYYNNIFYKSSSSGAWGAAYWYDSGHDVQYLGDYNSYVQTSSENAIELGAYGGGSNWYGFAFGANGPGHASGTWYNFKSWYNDANSKGTGATVAGLPPFANVSGHDYSLTAHYQGMKLSNQSWYIPEMGADKNGNARASWDIGAYEFGGTPNTPPSPPRNLRMR